MLPQTSKKISYLQFTCALMIVGLHTAFGAYFPDASAWLGELNRFVRNMYDAAIPTFFFLSAMLLYRSADQKSYGKLLLGKLRTLALPYVLWNAVFMAHSMLREYLTTGVPPVFDPLAVLMGLTIKPANSILWFIRTLLGLILLFPIVLWGVKRKWPAFAAICVCVALCCISSIGVSYYSLIYWMPVYLIGAMIGYWKKERFEAIPVTTHGFTYLAALLLLVILALLRPLSNVLHYLYWLPAPLLLWVLADVFAAFPKPPWWINASFYLYCSHLVVERYAVKLYFLIFNRGSLSFALGNILLPLLCASIALLCGWIVRMLLPSVYAIFSGWRQRREPTNV